MSTKSISRDQANQNFINPRSLFDMPDVINLELIYQVFQNLKVPLKLMLDINQAYQKCVTIGFHKCSYQHRSTLMYNILKSILFKACLWNVVLFLIFAIAYFSINSVMQGLYQTKCNLNNQSVNKNTLVKFFKFWGNSRIEFFKLLIT